MITRAVFRDQGYSYPKPASKHVCCPACKSDDIFLSNLQKRKRIYKRLVFVYYRCDLCCCRFKQVRMYWAMPLIAGACLATLVNFVLIRL